MVVGKETELTVKLVVRLPDPRIVQAAGVIDRLPEGDIVQAPASVVGKVPVILTVNPTAAEVGLSNITALATVNCAVAKSPVRPSTVMVYGFPELTKAFGTLNCEAGPAVLTLPEASILQTAPGTGVELPPLGVYVTVQAAEKSPAANPFPKMFTRVPTRPEF